MYRSWWILAILTMAVTLSFADRFLIAVLIQPIKAELGLTDGFIGILTGFSFAAFYALLGVPLARFADRGNRRSVVVGSIAIWSAMTGLTGVVTNFWQMAFTRFAVGAGEAGIVPVALAFISDVFPLRRRTTAMAIFTTGGSLGLVLAFVLGSRLEAVLGWRWAFGVMALPGLILAPMAWASLPRGVSLPVLPGRENITGMIIGFWRNRNFRHFPFYQAALTFLNFGQTQWLPAYFERSFGVGRVILGAKLGAAQGIATILGMILGGIIADRLTIRNAKWPLWFSLFAIVAAIMPVLLLYTSNRADIAYLYVALVSFLLALPVGTIAAQVQTIVSPSERASAASIVMMVAAFLGLGCGPVVIGVLSDILSPYFAGESLRYALLIVGPCSLIWAGLHVICILRQSSKGR